MALPYCVCRINCGGAGELLQAFAAEYMPLREAFPPVPGYAVHLQGAIAGVVLDLQAEDTNIFPTGMAYATVHDGPQVNQEKLCSIIDSCGTKLSFHFKCCAKETAETFQGLDLMSKETVISYCILKV